MTDLSRRDMMGGFGTLTAAAAMRPKRAKAAAPVTVWCSQGFYQAEDQALKDFVTGYEKQSGTKIDLQIMNGPDLITKAVAALHVGDVPDVIHAAGGGLFLMPLSAWNDQLLEVSDVIAGREPEFLPAALSACRFYNNVTRRRGYYGVPIKAATMMEQIWRPLVEQAGFSDTDIPKTQDAFFDFFQVTQDRLRSKGKRIFGLGYSMATKENDSNNLFQSFLIAYGGANIVTADGQLTIDEPAVRQAIVTSIERLTTPYKKGYVPPGSINWGDVDNNNAFFARQVVMTPNATLSIAVAQMEKADQYREIITTGVPHGNDGKPVPSVLGVAHAAIPKEAKNIDGAKAFLRAFLDPGDLNVYLKEARGRWLPVMPAALKTDPYWLDPSDPHRPVAVRHGMILPTLAPWQTFNPAYAQVVAEQIWPQTLANVTQKGMTSEQAAEDGIKRVKAVFQRYTITA
jgi:multiple sugar transport system substrate-binding protein